MTDIKVLPSNLKEIEKKPRFVQFYKSHNVEALQDILVDIEVNYRSDDNKAALVWRVMDAKGMDFDDAANDRVDEQNDSTSENELNTGENVETAEADTDENVQTVQDDTSDEHDAPSEQPNVEVGTETDSAVADSIEKSNEVVDTAEPDATSNISDSTDDSANEADKPAETSGQLPTSDSAPTEETPSEQTVSEKVDVEPEHVSINNTGDFGIYEPASHTLLPAGETTKAYISQHASREKIINNINQLNSTRGKKLHVTN